MRATVLVLGGLLAGGCERKAKEPRYEGPMPVTFGDCAGAEIAWVSGPRPAPFTAEQAAPVWIEDRTASRDRPSSSPSPTTTATTEEPSPAPTPADDEAVAARRQALEQARAAGVLGSVSQSGAFATITASDQAGIASLLGPPSDSVEDGNGGFGLADMGLGPHGLGGGLGNGWGTIGTGRYGTTSGMESATGLSVGHGRIGTGPWISGPTVTLAPPTMTGNLDKNIIRRFIKRNIQKITFCYEKRLMVKPAIAGRIDTEFFITPNGDVASSSAKGFDDEVASCVAMVIKNIEFPKPSGGGGVLVKYPFTFMPAEGGATPSTTIASSAGIGSGKGSGSAAGGGSAASGDAGSGSAAPPSTPGLHTSRRLYRETGPVDRTYLPGTANPLRVEQTALAECFRKGAKHYGTAVVELAYDAAGKTTGATVHGIDDDRVKKCVAIVARRAKREAAGVAAQRCSLAFGEMPASDLPALDVTGDAIVLAGKKLTTVDAAQTASALDHELPELRAAIRERVRAAGAVQAAVTTYGPLVVRPQPTTKMKVVTRVLRAIVGAGDDFVLASRVGADWKLVEPLALPLVPVPFGTGAVWNHVKVTSGVFGDDMTPMVSLLVTPEKITIFQTAHEKLEIPHDQLQKVADELRLRKASGAFIDRADMEISTSDDLTYGDFLAIVEMAVTAGFTQWQLTSANALVGER